MSDYLKATGGRSRSTTEPAHQPAAQPSARPLTQRQQEKAQLARAQVHEHMPEMLPVIKDFVAAGLIDGWRNVRVTLDEEGHKK